MSGILPASPQLSKWTEVSKFYDSGSLQALLAAPEDLKVWHEPSVLIVFHHPSPDGCLSSACWSMCEDVPADILLRAGKGLHSHLPDCVEGHLLAASLPLHA